MAEQLVMTQIVEGRNWGGARKGAGRKLAATRSSTAHRERAEHKWYHPVHVTLRAVSGLPSLRTEEVYEMLRTVLHGQTKKRYAAEFHIAEFSIQDNHLHLLVEAGPGALRPGMSGFMIAFARRLNLMLGRKGKVWADRYNVVELDSPRQVKNALQYIFRNSVKHGIRSIGGAPDLYSSIFRFRKLAKPLDFSILEGPWAAEWPEAKPRTWFLAVGWWQKHGLLEV